MSEIGSQPTSPRVIRIHMNIWQAIDICHVKFAIISFPVFLFHPQEIILDRIVKELILLLNLKKKMMNEKSWTLNKSYFEKLSSHILIYWSDRNWPISHPKDNVNFWDALYKVLSFNEDKVLIKTRFVSSSTIVIMRDFLSKWCKLDI